MVFGLRIRDRALHFRKLELGFSPVLSSLLCPHPSYSLSFSLDFQVPLFRGSRISLRSVTHYEGQTNCSDNNSRRNSKL
ncbi:hypothetical protein MA16_Dca001607 [Dendrobium catenatum]|uniref:Uncharacterized protein n=1 Tax=Dendrobium catenatum TaxID=906689 RepID=A0A2I0WMX8_9ASPA|nr:hypothetical protein MA16_Dca001607 [Dendrobium catenatum]